MKYLLYFSLFLFLSFSCKKNIIKEVELELIDGEMLISTPYKIDVDLFRPAKLFIHKNKLIVYDEVREDIFKVFDIDKISYLYSFGDKGSGPGEFISTDKESINSSEYFEILDRRRLYYYNIMDTVALRIDSTLFVTNRSAPINSLKKMSDSVYLFTDDGYSGKMNTEFMLRNTLQNTTESFGKAILFDKNLKNLPAPEQAWALMKSIAVNQNRTAAFYYYYPYFKIFTNNNDFSLYRIRDVELKSGKCIYFTEPYATDKYIYVMWIAKSKTEVMTDLKNYNPKLLVFDWDGNMRHNYSLDIPIISFAVKEDDSKLYAVSFNEDDINTLYVYNLEKSIEISNYTRFNNDFFSFNLMKGYHYLEKDTYTEDGYNVFFTSLGQGLNKTYPELESIAIRIYTPNGQTNINSKIDDIIANFQKNSENFQIQNLNKENVDFLHCSYYKNAKEYDGTVSQLFFNSYLFSEENKIIDINFISTTPDVEKYIQFFESAVISFKLN
ncbi:MAG: TolB-like 6-bladed beta-propeller domain-containing protein [Dysgonamonadaceae bacterium]|jgi:hypothetical protein|nr:TolB-like 6-bladed beta-propeller domain-containing protein [Dysgonamonadaceae bacterium]